MLSTLTALGIYLFSLLALFAAIAGLLVGTLLLYQRLRSPNWNIARRRTRRNLIQLWVVVQRVWESNN